jgi:hypothetical protein
MQIPTRLSGKYRCRKRTVPPGTARSMETSPILMAD